MKEVNNLTSPIVLKFKIEEKNLLLMHEFVNFEIVNPYSRQKNLAPSYFLVFLGLTPIFLKLGTILSLFLPILLLLGILSNFHFNSFALRISVKNLYKNSIKLGFRTNIDCEFYVSESYLIAIKDSIKTECPWNCVKHITLYKNQILLLLDITDVLIIPQSAFASKQEFEVFYEKVLEYAQIKTIK